MINQGLLRLISMWSIVHIMITVIMCKPPFTTSTFVKTTGWSGDGCTKPLCPQTLTSFNRGILWEPPNCWERRRNEVLFGVKSTKGVWSRAVYVVRIRDFHCTMVSIITNWKIDKGRNNNEWKVVSTSINCKRWDHLPTIGAWKKSLNTKGVDQHNKCQWIGKMWPQSIRHGSPPKTWSSTSKLWECNDYFVMYLNSGDWGTWHDDTTLCLQAAVKKSLGLIPKLPSGFVQYVLHALVW